ncbi:hypothetical protein ND861_15805 [Leptospira sp. 2 VSF19]|uniref:Antibiotic biosynthesis monooxygenase n=1 Tax=Leptospira soteropolitanensis TaxID=2950025 RepID=A0AAW5VNL5_9LEPT|nr:hypothetical protein [Leptospira soteropolitanensis]MCW7494112.1 hypothetical protein [Leptospira soteropolitanensis]MCW7501622.1 hypothetical protein [Leptospira soteropolitanensis]MCW7523958.1 hypothetical protein [Leptospira soteropolitanensis]MCW7527823.1 hypothetical protein [Leptospira soteropolitanensis]MCW7531592.1 hypothetical protein [Leptospira soteropolitanensis]
MISATFIFKQKTSDEEFQTLDSSIESFVENHSEYLGKDQWSDQEKGTMAVVYYFQTQKGLDALKTFSDHKKAKSHYSKWYEGYQVIIAEITNCYGDGNLDHVTNRFKKD